MGIKDRLNRRVSSTNKNIWTLIGLILLFSIVVEGLPPTFPWNLFKWRATLKSLPLCRITLKARSNIPNARQFHSIAGSITCNWIESLRGLLSYTRRWTVCLVIAYPGANQLWRKEWLWMVICIREYRYFVCDDKGGGGVGSVRKLMQLKSGCYIRTANCIGIAVFLELCLWN